MDKNNLLPREIKIDQNLNVQFQPELVEQCEKIKQVVDHTDRLVTITQVDDSNADQVEQAIDDLATAQKLKRNIDTIVTNTRRWLNQNVVDNIMDQITTKLNDARFNELASRDAQAKQYKKDLRALRKTQYWKQIEPTFNANLANYPLIKQLAPQLTDFSLFKLRHPKMVSGAKNWHFGDKQMAELNQDLYDINECLTDLNVNQMQLPDMYRIQVLNSFIANPTKVKYLELKNGALSQYQMDEKQKELAKQAAAQPNSAQAKPAAASNPVNKETRAEQATKWLQQYTMQHQLLNIANNPTVKTKLIYDLIHQLDNPKSEFAQLLENSDNADEMELMVLNQIILV